MMWNNHLIFNFPCNRFVNGIFFCQLWCHYLFDVLKQSHSANMSRLTAVLPVVGLPWEFYELHHRHAFRFTLKVLFKCLNVKRRNDGQRAVEAGGGESGGGQWMGVRCSACASSIKGFHFSPSVLFVCAEAEPHSHTDAHSVAAHWTDSRQLTLCR